MEDKIQRRYLISAEDIELAIKEFINCRIKYELSFQDTEVNLIKVKDKFEAVVIPSYLE